MVVWDHPFSTYAKFSAWVSPVNLLHIFRTPFRNPLMPRVNKKVTHT